MTEAVGGAGQSAAQSALNAVSQAASAKAGSGMQKTNAKAARDDEPQPEGSAREQRQSDATFGEAQDQGRIENGGKVARRREREKTNEGDDADTSFAATIDSIGRSAPQIQSTDTTQVVQQAVRWTPEMAFGQITLDRTARTTPTDTTSVLTNTDTPMISSKLLKPESITALLAAQSRMLAGEEPVVDAASNESSDIAQPTPIVVESRKTYWRFDVNSAPTEALPSAASADASGATNPLAILAVASTAKGKDNTAVAASPAAVSDKMSEKLETASIPVSAASTPADDAPSRQSFGQSFTGEQGGGASPRDHSSNGSVERKVSENAAPRSVEPALPEDAGSTSGLAPATTQVRNSVIDALTGDAGDAKPSNVAASLQDRPAAPAQVLRTLELTLSPPDLGSVKLKLSLKSNELSIEAETSKAATAKILNDDREGLKQNLQNAGYDVSTLKISDAAASSAMGSNSSQTGGQTGAQTGNGSFQDGSQARASFADRQGGDMQRRDGAAQERGQQRSRDGNASGSQAVGTTGPLQSNAIYI